MLELLTGTGLATAAGLNAYIPLLAVGLLARYTDLLTLPASWAWLDEPWTLGILAVLLLVEVTADKIPAVDHVNDLLQTVVRPTAGGLVFGASTASETAAVQNPADFFSDNSWVPILIGAILGFSVHAVKALARPVINAATLGIGAPIASTVEDGASVTMSLLAIVAPILVLVALLLTIPLTWWVLQRLRRRRAARRASTAVG